MPPRFAIKPRKERAACSLCLGGCVPDDTTQQRNTHIRDVREVRYCVHPWYGREVWVHASLVRRGRAVAYCSLEHENNGYWKCRSGCWTLRAARRPRYPSWHL